MCKPCADYIVAQLCAMGFDNCEAVATARHPVVYGEWLRAGADKPTVLVYAHYDVQPVDPLPLWDSEPFAAELRDGRMYARGASDNKAGVWGNLKVLEALLRANGELPVNVKIMFEGEEESGSPSIEGFVKANKDRLQADVLLNCDGDLQPDKSKVGLCRARHGNRRSARQRSQRRYSFGLVWRAGAESAACGGQNHQLLP